MIGNKFLVRGCEDGKRVLYKDDYFPTLFVRSKRKSKYKSAYR